MNGRRARLAAATLSLALLFVLVPSAPAHAGLPPGPPDRDFDRLARCESSGRWGLNTGNGYYGGLQFSVRTWRSLGANGLPHRHPRLRQIAVARAEWRRSGWRAWPHCARRVGLTR
jgi:hypothetical protein